MLCVSLFECSFCWSDVVSFYPVLSLSVIKLAL